MGEMDLKKKDVESACGEVHVFVLGSYERRCPPDMEHRSVVYMKRATGK